MNLNLKKEYHDTNLEYVFVKGNRNELWEIDYRRKIALDVSEVIKSESIADNLIIFKRREDARIFIFIAHLPFLIKFI